MSTTQPAAAATPPCTELQAIDCSKMKKAELVAYAGKLTDVIAAQERLFTNLYGRVIEAAWLMQVGHHEAARALLVALATAGANDG
jgi:hypothetical protein